MTQAIDVGSRAPDERGGQINHMLFVSTAHEPTGDEDPDRKTFSFLPADLLAPTSSGSTETK
jgi:hypothetical protein